MSEAYPASVVEWARSTLPDNMVRTLDQLIQAKEIVIVEEQRCENAGKNKY